VTRWHKKHPGAFWRMATGPKKENGAGLVVIDIDNHDQNKNGFVTCEQLREEHSDPIETVTVKTGGGGQQAANFV
jgi:hypothetical protein